MGARGGMMWNADVGTGVHIAIANREMVWSGVINMGFVMR